MTPKEKAIGLINKFRNSGNNLEIESLKSYALIVVDECIKEHCHESENKNPIAQDRWIEYWQNIKQEILNIDKTGVCNCPNEYLLVDSSNWFKCQNCDGDIKNSKFENHGCNKKKKLL